MRLSKSQYQKAQQCERRLWLHRHRAELATPPNDFQKALFAQGHEVGELARQWRGDGVLIAEGHRESEAALAATTHAMTAGATRLFEAAFFAANVLVRVDVLEKNNDGTWTLIEVKSSTGVKEENYADLALQHYVLEQAGLKISEAHLAHLNRRYVRGEAINLRELFAMQRLDTLEDYSYALSEVPALIQQYCAVIEQNEMPLVNIGGRCGSPYACEFKAQCWQGLASSSIHFLSRVNDEQRASLLDAGFADQRDIPADFKLSAAQRVQVGCVQEATAHLQLEPIREHLAELQYPLYFLDFETTSSAVPRFAGTGPYAALACQYSLHIQREAKADLEHVEYLHGSNSDPRRAVAEGLVQNIGAHGSVVVYHASFEGARIEEMADAFEDLREKLLSIKARLWDLEIPFAKRWYAEAAFEGRSSIKKVLPALVPELSYKTLNIQAGDTATQKYVEMVDPATPQHVAAQIRSDLLAYCALDSLAMVKILERLRKIAASAELDCA